MIHPDSKTRRPEFSHALLRTRLFSVLDGTAHSVWLAGPAGGGKTVLISTWVETRKHPCLWYTITPEDADPAAFFFHFSHGVTTLLGSQGNLPAFTAADAPTLLDFADHYFKKLRGIFPGLITVVFDNLHQLPTTAPLLSVIREILLPQSAPQLRTVVISREMPTASFAYLLTSGMLVISGAELRLDLEECGQMARLGGRKIGDREVAALHFRTDGWAAGIPLLLGQTTLEEEETAHPENGEVESVFDYFARKLLDHLPPEQRTFLMQAAHLPEMTGSMIVALTGRADGGRLLSQWVRKQLFVARQEGNSQPSYRFHDLFREFLLTLARQEWPATELERIRQQAATILEQSGEMDQAARLYYQMANWPSLARLILAQAPLFAAQSRFSTIATWLSLFPVSRLREDPWLSLWQGVALTFVQPDQAAPWLEGALDHFATHGPLEAAWQAWCGRMECAQILQRGIVDPVGWTRRFEELLTQGPMPPSLEARILNGRLFLYLFDNPAVPEAGKIIDRLMILCRQEPPHQKLAIYANIMFNLSYSSGDHGRMGIFWEALKQAFPDDLPPMLALQVEWVRAVCAIMSWRMADARTSLTKMQLLCHNHRFPASLSILPDLVSILLELSYDNYALTPSPNCLSIAENCDFPVGSLEETLGLISMGRGDWAKAATYFQSSAQVAQDLGFQVSWAVIHLHLAQVIFKMGDKEKAWGLMNHVYRLAEEQANAMLLARHGQLATLLCLDEGRRADAVVWLERALSTMEQSGQVQISGWGPGRAMQLVRLALEEKVHVAFIQRMLQLWTHLLPTPDMQSLDNWPWPVRLKTLGGLGIEVQGKPMVFQGRSQGKPLELLKLILTRNGRKAPMAGLADLLWPEASGDDAMGSLNTTIHRLRKLLNSPDCLLVGDGEISLNPQVCQLDLWSLECLVAQGEDMISRNDPDAAEALLSRILSHCQGPFLGTDEKNSWVLPSRERWRGQITRILSRIGQFLESAGRLTQAEDGYRCALEQDGLSEVLYQRLMQCLARQQRIPDALLVYRRCRTMLDVVMGTSPSSETERIYQQLMGKN
ncbi:MAG: hypothetical protein HQL55_08460 [Magnetococcales bacterium]|nr:hypothetical protein [Magnetococcales bacterium]